MGSPHVWMNSSVKNWILKTSIFNHVFRWKGESRCIWRKMKTIKLRDMSVSYHVYASKIHRRSI